MESTILEKFATKKKQQEQQNEFSKKFEQLVEKLLQKLDINVFERIISRIYVDKYIMSVSGISYKLDKKSINLVNKLVSMFSNENINAPMDYSKNSDILAFMEEVNGEPVSSPIVFDVRMPGSVKFTEFLKKYNNDINNMNQENYDYLHKMFYDI